MYGNLIKGELQIAPKKLRSGRAMSKSMSMAFATSKEEYNA